MRAISLDIRKTHKYVGTYQHEDDWENIGTAYELACRTLKPSESDEEDYCEPLRTLIQVKVRTYAGENPSLQQIKRALRDTYTQSGCHHEYDCCGCRSYHVDNVRRRRDGTFCVTVDSSRNF